MTDSHVIIQLERLQALRDIGIPLARKKDALGQLDFDIFMSKCGTCGCLLGWWATTKYAKASGWKFSNEFPVWIEDGDMLGAYEYFGINPYEWDNLFGEGPKSLDDRALFLDELIVERKSNV